MTSPPVGNAVHLWTYDLAALPEAEDALAATLSDNETARVRALIDPAGRRRFVLRRGLLRRILSAYSDQAPETVAFRFGAQGKPSPGGIPGLSFNLSSSGDRMLVAVADGREIGVDVECRRPIKNPLGLARRFFSPDEAEWLARLDTAAMEESFWWLWTCKEAVVKASGTGLTEGLRGFTVVRTSDGAARLIGRPGVHLHCWAPADGDQAALATPFVAEPVVMT